MDVQLEEYGRKCRCSPWAAHEVGCPESDGFSRGNALGPIAPEAQLPKTEPTIKLTNEEKLTYAESNHRLSAEKVEREDAKEANDAACKQKRKRAHQDSEKSQQHIKQQAKPAEVAGLSHSCRFSRGNALGHGSGNSGRGGGRDISLTDSEDEGTNNTKTR